MEVVTCVNDSSTNLKGNISEAVFDALPTSRYTILSCLTDIIENERPWQIHPNR